MKIMTFFTDNGLLIEDANVIIIEKADIRWDTDIHVASVECYGGWWEVYDVCGELCAYWEAEE